MNFIDSILMLLRWKQDGWEVHPLIDPDEFDGWF
jgi:hypothetical protein